MINIIVYEVLVVFTSMLIFNVLIKYILYSFFNYFIQHFRPPDPLGFLAAFLLKYKKEHVDKDSISDT